jgi:hypothetical protein
MAYLEVDFKREMITQGWSSYKLSELMVNPWVRDDRSGFTDPMAGVGNVTVTSMNTHTAWAVYRKTYVQQGDMFMGRLGDTGKLYEEYGLGSPGTYNLTKGKSIQVQKLKNWTVCVNDCWVLGAIHSFKTFHLVTKVNGIEKDIAQPNYFVVTGRELGGLLNYGYEPVAGQKGAYISFVCTNKKKAQRATLVDYATKMNAAFLSKTAKAKIALFAQGIH